MQAYLLLTFALLASGLTLAQSAPRAGAPLLALRGVVVADDGPATPLRRARIVVVRGAQRSSSVFTDLQGAFEVHVPDAIYQVEVTKAGFVPASVTLRPTPAASREARPLIGLTRGGVITGLVHDERGDPVPNVPILIAPLSAAGATPTGSSARSTQTDDRGEYRFGSLAAGAYVVRATSDVRVDIRPREERSLRHTASVDRAASFQPGGAISGTVVDEWGEPVEGASIALMSFDYAPGQAASRQARIVRTTDDRGRYRLYQVPEGSYYAVATPPRGDYPAGAVAPTFYPRSPDIAHALIVEVRTGHDTSGIDLTLTAVPTARVHGVVLDASGRPGLTGQVGLTSLAAESAIGVRSVEVPIGPDGTFEVRGVVPGEYVLHAIGKGSAGARELALQPLSVAGADVGPVIVSTLPGSRVSGTVSLAGGATQDLPARLGVTMVVAESANAPMLAVHAGGFVAPDGSFEMSGVSGPGRFVLEGAPHGWWLQSVRVGSREVTDEPMMFGTLSYSNVSITIATTGGRIDGLVVDELGRTSKSGTVVAFSTDPSRWFYRSRHLKLTRSGADGRFLLSGLPPGEYWVAAVPDAINEQAHSAWQHAGVLSRLTARANRVTLRAQDVVTVHVRRPS